MDDSTHRTRSAQATESLTRHLAPLAFDGTAHEVTSLLTDAIAQWADRCGFVCEREVRSRYTRVSRRGFAWPGFLDLAGAHPNGLKLAVELDRGTKRRSLDKLIAEADAGAVAIWVRWFGRATVVVPRSVGLVELRAHRVQTADGYRYQRTPHLDWPRAPERSIRPVKSLYQPQLVQTQRQAVPKQQYDPEEGST